MIFYDYLILRNLINDSCQEIPKERYVELVKNFGITKAYEYLGTGFSKDIGIHPMSNIVGIENYQEQLPESGEAEFGLVLAFKFNQKYYVYSECG